MYDTVKDPAAAENKGQPIIQNADLRKDAIKGTVDSHSGVDMDSEQALPQKVVG